MTRVQVGRLHRYCTVLESRLSGQSGALVPLPSDVGGSILSIPVHRRNL